MQPFLTIDKSIALTYLKMADGFGEGVNYVYAPDLFVPTQPFQDDTRLFNGRGYGSATFPGPGSSYNSNFDGSLEFTERFYKTFGYVPDYNTAAEFACGSVFQDAVQDYSPTEKIGFEPFKIWNSTDNTTK